jgi:hypothetical protein
MKSFENPDCAEVSGEFLDQGSVQREQEEVRELQEHLKAINDQLGPLEHKIAMARKASLTNAEEKRLEAHVEDAVSKAKKLGSDEDIAARIGRVSRERFVEDLRASQISESPQGRELERLRNRKFDLEERLKQLGSGEDGS